jgi:hypothetical protein
MMGFPTPGILDVDMNLNSAVRVSGGKKFFFSQPAHISDPDDATFINRCIPGAPLSLKVGDEIPNERKWLMVEREVKALLSNPEVKTVCIDGLTVLSRWLLDYCEGELIRAGVNIKKEYLAKFQNFINIMVKFVGLCRIGGKTVFMTCHQTADQNDITKSWYYNLAIPGQLKDTLGGLFTDVWGLSTQTVGDSVDYYINTRPTNLHVALKTSFDLDSKIKVTDLHPDAIWRLLEPKLSFNIPTK